MSGLNPEDIVDIQVVNGDTGHMIQQFYQTATGSTTSSIDNTETLPAEARVAYTVYVHRPQWGAVIATAAQLHPTTTLTNRADTRRPGHG